jgi:hypothetical protein
VSHSMQGAGPEADRMPATRKEETVATSSYR